MIINGLPQPNPSRPDRRSLANAAVWSRWSDRRAKIMGHVTFINTIIVHRSVARVADVPTLTLDTHFVLTYANSVNPRRTTSEWRDV